jgi:fructose/tagatose bisphosphate aldolase
MSIITDRDQALEIINRLNKKKVSMAIFCTASHWNTEAILVAASRLAQKNNINKIPLAVALTFNYPYMPHAKRVTYTEDPRLGFLSVMEHLKVLCGDHGSPYENVIVLPHVDHGDPVKDKWVLTEGLSYLASVMFDAQKYKPEENIKLTSEYMKKYGKQVLVEGIMEELSVEGHAVGKGGDRYIEKAVDYISRTGVDFLVADLGTEQQSSSIGKGEYLGGRARELTSELGKDMLVLHGTSCLSNEQMSMLPRDGIVRVNMWTRIVREAGQYAARRLAERMDRVRQGDFESSESKQYLFDSIEKAADIMEETLELLGYKNLG